MEEFGDFDLNCKCDDRFIIESHGDGHALYFGRCNHRHGFNLGQISDTWPNTLEILNTPMLRIADLEAQLAEAKTDRQQAWKSQEILLSQLDKAQDDVERLREALTPSQKTKAAYIGEFRVPYSFINENEDEFIAHVDVPWTTIKEIMSAILKHAAIDAARGSQRGNDDSHGGKDE
jgi:hypothetical protein